MGRERRDALMDAVYDGLCRVFGQSDVVRDYASAACGRIFDFYVKSRDMYVELDPCPENRDAAGRAGLDYVAFMDVRLRDMELWLAMGCPDGRDWARDYSWLPERTIGYAPVPVRIGMSSAGLGRVVKSYQFSVFYAREIALWDANGQYGGLPLQLFLYHNRWKHMAGHKLPHELSDLEIARGFTISGIMKGYTAFDTGLMDAVMRRYDIKSVYDPCSGWGERALYCKAHGDLVYLGVDVNPSLFPGYDGMCVDFGMSRQRFVLGDSASVLLKGSYDAVVTCPPYGNTEIYSEYGAENLPGDGFLAWWRSVVENSLSVGPAYFCFQVNRKWRDAMLSRVLDAGFELADELFPKGIRASHMNRRKDGTVTKKEFETMLVCGRK